MNPVYTARGFLIKSKLVNKSFINSVNILIRSYCAGIDCKTLPEKKGLVLGVWEGEQDDTPIPTPACCKINENLQGKLMELVINSGSLLKKGAGFAFNNIHEKYWSIVVVNIGKKKQGFNLLEAIDMDRESVRYAAGLGAQLLFDQHVGHIYVDGLGRPEQAAEGAALAIWRYQDNKKKEHRTPIPTLELFEDADHDGWQRGLFKAEAQNIARRLTIMPPNLLTPTSFAQLAVNTLCPCGIRVEIRDKDYLEMNKFNGILMMGKGSCEPPILLEMSYCGGPETQKPIVLVGKGVTFDSGGLCLRRCDYQKEGTVDVSGAASVLAILRACAALSLPINVTGVTALVENTPSGMAVRCGDIFRTVTGEWIEIERTSYDGRVLVSDSICYAIRDLKPRLIIDLTTTVSGIKQLLGSGATGCFSNSEYMWRQIRKAGIISGDRMWRLPLWSFYKKQLQCCYPYVDMNNTGVEDSGFPCVAAAFISQFVKCVDWLHLDVSATGSRTQNRIYPYYTHGLMYGRPVRTIIQLLYQLACPNPCDKP